jgi:hypothetical protein
MNKVAAILGGGPSLLDEIKNVPMHAELYGINHHASYLVKCDYIVFNDFGTWDLVKRLPGKKISRWPERSDICRPFKDGQISGVCALEYCVEKDYDEILLAGFDCYQKDEYFHSPGQPTGASASFRKLKDQLDYWWVRDLRIKALGGPLVSIYNVEPYRSHQAFYEVNILMSKTVKIDEHSHVNFVPGVQKLAYKLYKVALDNGLIKE